MENAHLLSAGIKVESTINTSSTHTHSNSTRKIVSSAPVTQLFHVLFDGRTTQAAVEDATHKKKNA